MVVVVRSGIFALFDHFSWFLVDLSRTRWPRLLINYHFYWSIELGCYSEAPIEVSSEYSIVPSSNSNSHLTRSDLVTFLQDYKNTPSGGHTQLICKETQYTSVLPSHSLYLNQPQCHGHQPLSEAPDMWNNLVRINFCTELTMSVGEEDKRF